MVGTIVESKWIETWIMKKDKLNDNKNKLWIELNEPKRKIGKLNTNDVQNILTKTKEIRENVVNVTKVLKKQKIN